jgi:AcrR family transcriptional regulator
MGHKHYRPSLKTAKDARAIRTRKALRSAMLKLLELKPLEQITILDICEAANVGYTTYFRHHPTKESLLDDVAAAQIAQLVALTLPVAESSDIRAAGMALFAYVDEHRKLWSTLLTGGAERAMRNEFLRISRQVALTRSRPNQWPPADLSTILIVCSTIELLSWWLRQEAPLSIKEVAEIYERVIITPTIHMKRVPPSRAIRRRAPKLSK